MATKRAPKGAAAARATRHSRDLAIELKKAEAALKKAQRIVAQLGKTSADARPASRKKAR